MVNKYFKKFYYWFFWNKKKSYNYKRRVKYVFKNILILLISIWILFYSYNNLGNFEGLLWFLLIASGFFIIKHSYKLIKEGNNWYKRQINLVKLISIFLLLLGIWQIYNLRENIFFNLNFIYSNLTTKFILLSTTETGIFLSYIIFGLIIILGLLGTIIPTSVEVKIGSWVILLIIIFTILPFAENTLDSYLEDKDITEINTIQQIIHDAPERKEESQEGFSYVNILRNSYNKNNLNWDERAYNLAIDRAKDMYERDYFDHVTPEGTCAYTIKGNYGFKNYEDVAENIGAQMWESGSYTKNINVKEQVDGWMESRGHRYNLLYSTHKSGAIGCYYGVCVFFGVNNDGFGNGCNTGDEGLAFWQTASNQIGEV